MTEAEWLACTDPARSLDFLQRKMSYRKLRLFACACCRRVWHFLEGSLGQESVEVAERFVDGAASAEEMRLVGNRPCVSTNDAPFSREHLAACAAGYASITDPCNLEEYATYYAKCVSVSAAYALAVSASTSTENTGRTSESRLTDKMLAEQQEHAAILRDICGLLAFRPATFDPAWLTPKVATLAQTIYRERAFDRLPILADALEEVGCNDSDILNHCRQPGKHVRGCWVVDLLLDKK